MSEQQQSTRRPPASPWQHAGSATAFAGQPAGLWAAALGCVAMIIGGVGPWATAWHFTSISGTSMHGGREVAVGVVGLLMLALHMVSGARLPLIGAGIAGALGAMGAVAAWDKISTNGAVTVLGIQYQFIDVAWGLYLVLAGAITLTVCACALAWQRYRATR
jgi:hypothetical protein